MKKLICLSFIFFLIGCSEEKVDTLFRLLSESESGVKFSNDLSSTDDFNIIEYLYFYNGGGVSVGDINNDGLPDLFFTGNQVDNKLYLNKGNLHFEDITEKAFKELESLETWSNGTTMADVNGDGYLDLYISQLGDYKIHKGHNLFYLNNQNGTFSEVSEEWGLDFSGFSTQAAFFDYDLDGDLDMYLLNHAVHTTRSYSQAQSRSIPDSKAGDRLYQNQLAQGQENFLDVTQEAGIYSSLIGYGLGVGVSDINDDGWPDIYVTNDFHENDYLYLNQQDGTFKEVGEQWIGHMSRFAMGNDIADLNGDQKMDIITLDMLPSDNEILKKSGGEESEEVYEIKIKYGYHHQYSRNALQINSGDGFQEVATFSGIHATDWSWAPLIADFDMDGLPDIFITNGIVKRPNDLDYINYLSNLSLQIPEDEREKKMIAKMPSVKLQNFIFQNDGNLKFSDQANSWGLNQKTYSNGSTYADLDLDGDLDLIVNNINERAFIYENTFNQRDSLNFLQVSLRGNKSNSFGVGAKVSVHSNENVYTKENNLSRGFLSSVEPKLHFSFPKKIKIDSILIDWEGKKVQVERAPRTNQHLVVKYEEDKIQEQDWSASKKLYVISEIPFKHQENTSFNDFDNEPLIPHKLSSEGPALAVGDVNGDGINEFFIGGARNQTGKIYRIENDKYVEIYPNQFASEFLYEDVHAAFLDFDGDKDLDLYVVSGGNDAQDGSPLLQDRLYRNDGTGRFQRTYEAIPEINTNGSSVTPGDFDSDGDLDLFIGSLSIPGHYGEIPNSFLLENKEGAYVDITPKDIRNVGMVKDASWSDIDGDGDLDLLIVGYWMPICLFENVNSNFQKSDIDYFRQYKGLWESIEIKDLDGNGYQDILVGNLGLNTKLNASSENPIKLHLDDFDRNGTSDPIIFYQSKTDYSYVPFATKDQMSAHIPLVKKKYPDYSSFSKVRRVEDIFSIKETTIQLEVNTLEHGIFYQTEDGFDFKPFPSETQLTRINDILIQEDKIYFAGNFFENSVNIGRQDANFLFSSDYELSNIQRVSTKNKVGVAINSISDSIIISATNNDLPVILKRTY